MLSTMRTSASWVIEKDAVLLGGNPKLYSRVSYLLVGSNLAGHVSLDFLSGGILRLGEGECVTPLATISATAAVHLHRASTLRRR